MTAAWKIQEVAWPADVTAAIRAFIGDREAVWLDSANAANSATQTSEAHDALAATTGARYSLLGARHIALLEQFENQPATFSINGRLAATDANGWRLWRQVQQRVPRWPALPWDVAPGWVGYIGFEMARQLERLPQSHAEDLGLPLLRLTLFDRAIVLDHWERRAFAVCAEGLRATLNFNKTDDESDAKWLERWQQAATNRATILAAKPPPVRLHWEQSQADHERRVRRALDYIAAGDIYQVNLAHRLRLEGIGDPFRAYAALRYRNPAPYAAFLAWPDGAVASASPELFLRLRGRDVLTRPIKGTRPRTRDPLLDGIYQQQLLASEKDAAELAMIIDLHRNDLGRVCEYGSVRVPRPRAVEAHPRVFHTVADVTGRLAPDKDALDLLMACFPAGSISGVPKIRAMQIIDELEPVARGVYTGAIGFLGLDGQMTFNVAIRTLQMRDATAALHVGGGIVADSDPAEEYEETLAKARGIVEAFGINYEWLMANG